MLAPASGIQSPDGMLLGSSSFRNTSGVDSAWADAAENPSTPAHARATAPTRRDANAACSLLTAEQSSRGGDQRLGPEPEDQQAGDRRHQDDAERADEHGPGVLALGVATRYLRNEIEPGADCDPDHHLRRDRDRGIGGRGMAREAVLGGDD